MINTILWTLLGLPIGYFTCSIIEPYYYVVYNRHFSDTEKSNIMVSIIFLSFLRGYTNNDLVTNIKNIFF